jgi:hypothetical protein
LIIGTLQIIDQYIYDGWLVVYNQNPGHESLLINLSRNWAFRQEDLWQDDDRKEINGVQWASFTEDLVETKKRAGASPIVTGKRTVELAKRFNGDKLVSDRRSQSRGRIGRHGRTLVEDGRGGVTAQEPVVSPAMGSAV